MYQGSELWYNWVSNHTQVEQPDEMPQYMLDEVRVSCMEMHARVKGGGQHDDVKYCCLEVWGQHVAVNPGLLHMLSTNTCVLDHIVHHAGC